MQRGREVGESRQVSRENLRRKEEGIRIENQLLQEMCRKRIKQMGKVHRGTK